MVEWSSLATNLHTFPSPSKKIAQLELAAICIIGGRFNFVMLVLEFDLDVRTTPVLSKNKSCNTVAQIAEISGREFVNSLSGACFVSFPMSPQPQTTPSRSKKNVFFSCPQIETILRK